MNGVGDVITISLKYSGHMTDHSGPRRREFHPRTNCWPPPIEVTQFWHSRSSFGAQKAKKDYIYPEAGEKYETKVVGNGSSSNGRQNSSSGV